MTFNWDEFLEVAKFLSDFSFGKKVQFTHEAAIRSATSRAYYSAFCKARECAVQKYNTPVTHTAKDHQIVRDEYFNRGKHDIVDELQDLRDWRNDCDYENNLPQPAKWYLASLSSSENVLNLLKKL